MEGWHDGDDVGEEGVSDGGGEDDGDGVDEGGGGGRGTENDVD